MGKVHEKIDEKLAAFIAEQPMFFVATAPSGPDGHVNVSPKGMRGTFRVLGEHRVAYLDWIGSGAETVAHLRDNGRITIMFCAFQGPPTIVRLHGHGTYVRAEEPAFAELVALFDPPETVGLRGVVTVEVTRVSDSCGFSVPYLAYEGDRDLLVKYWEHRDGDYADDYRVRKNTTSIDGMPALDNPATARR
ncbi:pyridoxamine 5'-phosphate oxidase family protein [Luedemannella helvata]|uniref:Pyridoxamine 5'-phosphate oxidase family protein n=1 Tax=Luedemannella helvata TaxID=349315 RepID=A0ABN2KLU7_9ACTN